MSRGHRLRAEYGTRRHGMKQQRGRWRGRRRQRRLVMLHQQRSRADSRTTARQRPTHGDDFYNLAIDFTLAGRMATNGQTASSADHEAGQGGPCYRPTPPRHRLFPHVVDVRQPCRTDALLSISANGDLKLRTFGRVRPIGGLCQMESREPFTYHGCCRLPPERAGSPATIRRRFENAKLTAPDDPSSVDQRLEPGVVAALFVKHAEELRRFLMGVVRNHELAADVLQITFAKAVELGHTAREESLKGWLFRVAFNEAIAQRRRLGVQSRANTELANRGLRESPTPESHLLRWENVEQVRAALEKLPAEQREVVRMRIYEDKKFIEIATELGLPLGTVLTRMQLALKKLRKYFESGKDSH